jgi:hypothetical protein
VAFLFYENLKFYNIKVDLALEIDLISLYINGCYYRLTESKESLKVYVASFDGTVDLWLNLVCDILIYITITS